MPENRGRRPTAEERAKVFKALADPSRVSIIDMLGVQGSLSGTELAERLGISLALLCHHWQVLADAGIVRKRRVGQSQYCTVDYSRLQMATAAWTGAGRGRGRASEPPAGAAERRR